MANQILVNPYPYGSDCTQNVQAIRGSIVLAGSSTSNGEFLDWTKLASGIGYNEVNFAGQQQNGSGAAYVTALSGDGTTVTATANNNFSVGDILTFVGATTTLGLLLNGVQVTVASASATQFTFASTATGSGSGEVGLAVTTNAPDGLLTGARSGVNLTVTALSADGTTITVTAANNLLPGAEVTFSVATGSLGPKLTGTYTVVGSTGTAFTFLSALTGATGVGTAVGINPPSPFSVKVWSANASGYEYFYDEKTGALYTFVTIASPPASIGAVSYPAAVLGDVLKYEALFIKG